MEGLVLVGKLWWVGCNLFALVGGFIIGWICKRNLPPSTSRELEYTGHECDQQGESRSYVADVNT